MLRQDPFAIFPTRTQRRHFPSSHSHHQELLLSVAYNRELEVGSPGWVVTGDETDKRLLLVWSTSDTVGTAINGPLRFIVIHFASCYVAAFPQESLEKWD